MKRFSYWFVVVLASALVALSPPLFASTFRVSPMKIEFQGHRATAILQVANEGDVAVTVQIQVLGWSQKGLEETFPPTDDIFFSPPIVKIAPHGVQLIRVALRHNEHLATEKADRLYIEEVPGPEQSTSTGIHTVLRIGIPIYREPANPAATYKLSWAANYTADGNLRVTATNSGEAHVVIRGLALSASGEKPVLLDSAQCVLAGGEREWLFNGDQLKHATQLSLEAVTERGTLHVEITPQHE